VDCPENRALIHELETVQWDEERKHEDARFANHRTDALLYAWRDARAFLSPERAGGPDPSRPPEYDPRREAGFLAAQKQKHARPWWDR
jgi:hypothetical protein